MHLTLKFLGDTPDESIEPLRAAIEQVVSAHQTIPIPLERFGVFPRLQQPRVLWVGPSQSWEQGHEAQRLAALIARSRILARQRALRPEGRPFSSHLTFARIKEGERQVGDLWLKAAR